MKNVLGKTTLGEWRMTDGPKDVKGNQGQKELNGDQQ